MGQNGADKLTQAMCCASFRPHSTLSMESSFFSFDVLKTLSQRSGLSFNSSHVGIPSSNHWCANSHLLTLGPLERPGRWCAASILCVVFTELWLYASILSSVCSAETWSLTFLQTRKPVLCSMTIVWDPRKLCSSGLGRFFRCAQCMSMIVRCYQQAESIWIRLFPLRYPFDDYLQDCRLGLCSLEQGCSAGEFSRGTTHEGAMN